MKTIEEINEISLYKANEWQEGYGIWQQGYMQGQKDSATEQKAIDDEFYKNIIAEESNASYESGLERGRKEMIDKACDWIDEYFPTRGNGETTFISIEAVKECFRKAMEE